MAASTSPGGDEQAMVGKPCVRGRNEALQVVDAADCLGRRQIVGPSIRRKPAPLRAEQRLAHQRCRPAVSRATMARAASAPSTVQVGGVGRPARASRKLVVDLSTQRSIARASFHTGTPQLAQRVQHAEPARHLLEAAAGDGADEHRVGQRGIEAGQCRARAARVVSKRARGKAERHRLARPASAKAARSARACQSDIVRGPVDREGDADHAERGVEQRGIEPPGAEALAGLDAR